MSNEIKKEGEQMGLLDELMDVGREAMGFVEGVRVTRGAERAVRRIEAEPVDSSVLPILRRIVEENRGQRVTLVIEEDEFRVSIGAGMQLKMGVGSTLGGAILSLAERVGSVRTEVTVGRPPLDNKQRASGEKDED